jgi:tRNA (cmo5U34)-methyltransferase
VAQYHDAPARYLELMRSALPLYDRLQDELVLATADLDAPRILDLGAGTGETARRCLEVHPEARVVALDASEGMLAIAAEVLGDRATLCPGGLEDPLPEGPFELIVSALAVHHLDGPGKADLFCRVAARLAPGGRFVLADVVVPPVPVARPAPLDPAVDRPDRLDDLVDWLEQADLEPHVRWVEGDLAVVAASRR